MDQLEPAGASPAASGRSPYNLPNAISAVRFPLAALFPLLDGPLARGAVVSCSPCS